MKQDDSASFNFALKEGNQIAIIDLIRDAHIRRAFSKFSESQVSTNTFVAVAIIFSIGAIITFFRYINFLRSDYTTDKFGQATALTVVHLLLIILFWTVAYLKHSRTSKSNKINNNWLLRALRYIQPALYVILPIGATAFLGMQLILRVHGGRCRNDDLYLDMLLCNPNNDTNGLPEETLAQLTLLPIVFHIILRDSQVGTFLISWLVSLCSIGYAGSVMKIRQTTPFLVIYFCYSLIILYDNQRQNLSIFFLAEKLKFSLGENERLADETHASELRHMIANVAHDLKTPLTSFLSGIEFISQIVVDWDERISNPNQTAAAGAATDLAFCAENLTAIHGCLDSIRNTNSFMIMTINRCIDFTKASKGLKLTPKLETIELQETVDLPIKVMRDFKSRLAINLLPISADICTHIISDRQWLQENILCLLSNAVKYSSRGTVEISVSLVSMPIVQSGESVRSKPILTSRRKRAASDKVVVPTCISETAAEGVAEIEKGCEVCRSSSTGNDNMSVMSYSVKGSESPSSFAGRGGGVVMPEPDSGKRRKLSNFVFNHAYSTLGQSKIFSEQMLTDLEGGSDRSHQRRDSACSGEKYQTIEEGRAWEADEGGGEEEQEDCSGLTPRQHSSETGMFLRIEVEDTGIGLSDEAMLSLFSPFKQAQRLAGGTGLGLYSLAKRLEALDGHYGVCNRRDQTPGSLFWFAIPYRPDSAFAHTQASKHRNVTRGPSKSFLNHTGRSLSSRMAQMRVAGHPHAAHPSNTEEVVDLESAAPSMGSKSMSSNSLPVEDAGARPSSGHSADVGIAFYCGDGADAKLEPAKLNILLVDDSLSILKMTTMMLRRGGHKVEQADNGAVGLEMVLEGYKKNRALLGEHTLEPPYDVVLMDLQMPVMDGLEAVRRLRAAERLQRSTAGKATAGIAAVQTAEGGVPGDTDTVRDFFFGSKKQGHLSSPTASSPTSAVVSPRNSNTTKRRRSSLITEHQLVIGVSANSDNETMVEAMKVGFDAFIGKPFSIDALYAVLHNQLEKMRKDKEQQTQHVPLR